MRVVVHVHMLAESSRCVYGSTSNFIDNSSCKHSITQHNTLQAALVAYVVGGAFCDSRLYQPL
jgi:hypothetical protein